ncbi:MAG: DNA primase [Syntrophothermus sp.]|uniref:phage/plasmid primase, P4 family n=1 Tax=Syntrophothermus sp. TaxID=2736299 RepID=UPI00257E3A7F|nr:phage/plasmid primase, P4 family [Syntrophothermus sp.]NSW83145.1 DNA primase [Syntrophothermus sp.]
MAVELTTATKAQDDAKAFYKALYGGGRGFVSLCTKEPNGGLQVQGFYHVSKLDELLTKAFTYSGKAHVYHGLHPLRKKPETGRGRKEDIMGAAFLAADVDAKDFIPDSEGRKKAKAEKDNYRWAPDLLQECKRKAFERIQTLPFEPTAIIDSGHGYYPFYVLREFWLFERPEELERFEELSQRLHKPLGGDSTYDVTRVLRLAGTLNIKPGCPMPCKVVEFNPDIRYNPSDLDDFLPATETGKIITVSFGKTVTVDLDALRLPEEIRKSIETGDVGKYPSRSERDMAITHYLVKAGLSDDQIWYIFKTQACGDKFREKGRSGDDYLALTISKARASKTQETASRPGEEEIHETDLGNARRLVKLHGRDLRYCHPWGKWFVWNGQRWSKDATAEVVRRAKDVVRELYAEASREPDEDRRKALAKHALRSESENRIAAMISLAESEPGIPVLPDDLDRDPWQLNCLNGTLNLRTGELRPHKREYLITRIIPVRYDPDATCPQWEAFLNRIMDGRQELIDFLQRAAGYSLTGITDERCLFILWGSGKNGKSSFLGAMALLLGDYATRTPTETLLTKKGDVIPNDIARLKGTRFVYASEAEEGRRLAEAQIKDLTGGDKVSARFMHAEWFDFTPEFKLWLGTNHKPVIRGTDNAIWDRIRLIPFTVRIPDSEQIPKRELMARFKAELPGILSWAVKGCLEWQKQGLGMPEEVKTATEGYRAEMDILADFLADCCIIDKKAKTKAADLYQAYCKWCEENGEQAIAKRTFGIRLKERGFESRRGTGGPNWWHGIGLVKQVKYSEPISRLLREDPNTSENGKTTSLYFTYFT